MAEEAHACVGLHMRVGPRTKMDSCMRMHPYASDLGQRDLGQRDLRRRPLAAPEHGGRLQAGTSRCTARRSSRAAVLILPASAPGGLLATGRFPPFRRRVRPHQDASFVEKRFVDARRRCLCTAASSTREAALRMRTPTPCIYITRICITHICLTRICVPGTSYPFGPLSMQRPVV